MEFLTAVSDTAKPLWRALNMSSSDPIPLVVTGACIAAGGCIALCSAYVAASLWTKPRRSSALDWNDRFWLRTDVPGKNSMIVEALLVCEKGLDWDAGKKLGDKFLQYPQFRQIARPRFLGGHDWVDPKVVDLKDHVIEVDLAQEAAKESDEERKAVAPLTPCLKRCVEGLMGKCLDPKKPLWSFYIIRNYRGAGDPAAVLFMRIHHALTDGIALTFLIMEACGQHFDNEAKRKIDKTVDKYSRPFKFTAWNIAKYILGAFFIFFKTTIQIPDPLRGTFKQTLTGRKKLAFISKITMAEVNEVRDALGGTVNDITLSCVSGAFRQYSIELKCPRIPRRLHAFMPMNLRLPKNWKRLGNKFALAIAHMPIGEADPLKRLALVRKDMDTVKDPANPAKIVVFVLMKLLGALPDFLQKIGVAFFNMKGSIVYSNVPGPSERLIMFGKPIDHMIGFVPQAGSIGIGAIVMSYAGNVTLSVYADEACLPDPVRFSELFMDAFRELQAAARQAKK